MGKPKIVVTSGDPAGVGPELCLRLFGGSSRRWPCDIAVFGDRAIFERVAQATGYAMFDRIESFDAWRGGMNDDGPLLIDFQQQTLEQLQGGNISSESGRASYDYLQFAIKLAINHRIDAIVTGPISKEAFSLAGILFPGHTELLAERTGTSDYCMMLTGNEMSCTLLTTHIALSDVPRQISATRLRKVIELTDHAMRRFGHKQPRMAVCGLNPHAGESGLFGREEQDIIEPTMESMRQQGYRLVGPLPPDTAFLPGRRKHVDCYICMYHDQGLIPLKTLCFDEAVNVTLGLPFVRTSVDHGTALDIAWQAVANEKSFEHAVLLASQLVS